MPHIKRHRLEVRSLIEPSLTEMKDNNYFIESSLTIRDVPDSAPTEIQIRAMSSVSPFTDSCNWKLL